MRYTTLTLALAGLILTSGCSSLVSLQPFVTAEHSVLDAGLTGIWSDPKGETTYVIQQVGNHYRISSLDSSETVRFEARLMQTGDVKILDLVQKDDGGFGLPVHFAVRVWPEGSTLRMALLDSDWLKDQALQVLPAQAVDDQTVITGPSEAVRAFVAKFGAEEKAYSKIETLHRVQ